MSKKVSKRKVTLLAIIHLFASNFVLGQNWSIEYNVEGDSAVYTLSHNKIIQGKSVDFFFPAYKYYQTSSMDAIESVSVGNNEIIEIELDSKNIACSEINFEIDLYAEGIDTIRFFLKTTDECLILVNQQIARKGYTYWPTAYFAVNLTHDDFSADITSIQIVGKSSHENRELIIGRLKGSKKIKFSADNMMAIDTFLSKYPI
ncbi:MAG: hypothetical protein LBD23_11755 [Oscillospiraceae bacterium]|jgi:hypothetical protein|nr:hypothetical protein [Oscillospiraceae bacterium]